MKIAAIDVGSNSVRLMMWADGKTLFKKLRTTRLGEGLNTAPYLSESACERTAQAVAEFVCEAWDGGADKVYIFATAAVRSSQNPELFTDKVKKLCGIDVDIVSGAREAEIGLAGALNGGDGGVIDVGGASTEVIVRESGSIVYSKSVNVGTVRILDACGRDLNKVEKFVAERLNEYGSAVFPDTDMRAVGGTATRLAAIKCGIKVYQPSVTDGVELSREEVHSLALKLSSMPVEEIRRRTICGNSADLIGGAAMLMYMIMEKFCVSKITVSEKDNLEGYVLSKGGN